MQSLESLLFHIALRYALRYAHNYDINKNAGDNNQVCRSSLFSGRNVRWPRYVLPIVSHSEYADGQTDRRTDFRPLRYAFRMTLSLY